MKALCFHMQFDFFDIDDFYCKCSREHSNMIVDERLVLMLDLARKRAGLPFIIESGYRCPEHNADVGGVSDSAHLQGKAADIRVSGNYHRYLILRSLIELGFRRLGIGENYIHVDVDYEKPLPRLWLY